VVVLVALGQHLMAERVVLAEVVDQVLVHQIMVMVGLETLLRYHLLKVEMALVEEELYQMALDQVLEEVPRLRGVVILLILAEQVVMVPQPLFLVHQQLTQVVEQGIVESLLLLQVELVVEEMEDLETQIQAQSLEVLEQLTPVVAVEEVLLLYPVQVALADQESSS
tara:strand:- start:173 stop:673 length:501 start_codon:yes stop_codon:yes gene_type:complete